MARVPTLERSPHQIIRAESGATSLPRANDALIAPPTIDSRIIKREVPILLLSVVAIPITLYDGVITRTEGLVLVGTRNLDSRHFKVREDNVYDKVVKRMKDWLTEVF